LLALETAESWIAVTISCTGYWYAGGFFRLFVAVAEIGPWSLAIVVAVTLGYAWGQARRRSTGGAAW